MKNLKPKTRIRIIALLLLSAFCSKGYSQLQQPINDLQYAHELTFWINYFDDNSTTSMDPLVDDIIDCVDNIKLLRGHNAAKINFDSIDKSCLTKLRSIYTELISDKQVHLTDLANQIPVQEKRILDLINQAKVQQERFENFNEYNKSKLSTGDTLDIAQIRDDLGKLGIDFDISKFYKHEANRIYKELDSELLSTETQVENVKLLLEDLRLKEEYYQSIDDTLSSVLIVDHDAQILYKHMQPFQSTNQEPETIPQRFMSQNLPMKTFPTQTEIIDAVAVLIANRFKEEVTLTFFGKLQENLKNDSLLGIFFPRTIKLFGSIENFTMPSIGPTWKAAFGEDLALLPVNLSLYLQEHSKNGTTINSEYSVFIVTLVEMLEQTRRGSNFFEIISKVRDTHTLDRSTTAYQILEMLDYLGKNLIDYESSDHYFIQWTEFNQFAPAAKTFFLEEMSASTNSHVVDPADMMYAIDAFRRLEGEIKYLHSSSEKINKAEDLNRYWTAIQDVIAKSAALLDVSDLDAYNDALVVLESVIQIQKAVESRSWGYLPLPISDLLDILINNQNIWNVEGRISAAARDVVKEAKRSLTETDIANLERCLRDTNTIDGSITVANCLTGIPIDKKLSRRIAAFQKLIDADTPEFLAHQNKRAIDHVINTISFISDVLTINDSEELTQVIQSKAAPVSSYKIKRNSRFSISVNSFPGLFVGGEWRPGLEDGAWTTGFTAPVGITFGFGHSTSRDDLDDKYTFQKKSGTYKTLTNNCFYFNIQLLDLAAPVSFRLSDPEAETLPQDVTFAQFFSPGISVGHGVKNTPVVLMLGGQFNPEIRSFENEASQKDMFSITATIAFDIPLFNVHNHIKKRRQFVEL